MLLQPLRAADLPDCHAVFLDSVWALAGALYSERQCEAWAPRGPWTAELAQGWEARLARSWGCRWLADDGRLAGFAWLCHDGEFDMLFVAPWAQRRGGASRMLAELEAQAAAAGVVALHAWASAASRPVFERAGYRVLRPNRVLCQGVTLDNDLLSKGGWQEPAAVGDREGK
ncbi:GNAT family N-acetyltransferase [Chromobacterium sp.]|uniref:GNAT family N-acetyltransferase n=1 Tax=Chromobacterium sp. TaxID=306190 RepID=UPI0035AE59F2